MQCIVQGYSLQHCYCNQKQSSYPLRGELIQFLLLCPNTLNGKEASPLQSIQGVSYTPSPPFHATSSHSPPLCSRHTSLLIQLKPLQGPHTYSALYREHSPQAAVMCTNVTIRGLPQTPFTQHQPTPPLPLLHCCAFQLLPTCLFMCLSRT